ncbi:MAG: hypothetical protein JWO02_4151 [Solirubrobacterales bacterium]|nr:hypothetical protein [Solirubrobacterales bacterium]
MIPARSPFRYAGLAAVAIAAVAVAVILLHGGSYRIHAHLANASGLVKGGLVQVAGRKVGTVSHITVTPDGQADVTLTLDDKHVVPLHRGTRATVRALGQAGIANHFVDLAPGSRSAPELDDGAVLPTAQTTSMVNLDALLDSFGAPQRRNLRRLIASSAQVFAGSGADVFNRMLGQLDPALAELGGMSGELARDRASIKQVIRSGAAAATAVDSRSGDLKAAIASSATALEAVAGQRTALAGLLDRAPAVLNQARGTLAHAGTALTTLRPALRDVPATAVPLDGFLTRIKAVLPVATPVVARLRRQLPDLRRSLAGLKPLQAPTLRALSSAATALKEARPIVRGARFYGSDFVLGILGGLVGAGSYNYSRWGHYERLDFIQPPQTSITGPGSDLLQHGPLIPDVLDIKTRLLRRCPGGNVPPAIDGSSPWVPDPELCTPSQDIPASVNEP